MRHAKTGRKLSRTASHRKALLSALSTALIKHKRIQTTAAKAKETRRIIEPLITRARDAYLREKSGEPVDIHSRRIISQFIQDKDAVKLLFTEIAEKVGKRPGGYTRVLKLGTRLGDGAEMAVIELVDYNEGQDNRQRKDRVARSKAALARRKAIEEQKAKTAAPAPVEEVAPAVDETPAIEEVAAVAEDGAPSSEAPAVDDAPAATEEEPKA